MKPLPRLNVVPLFPEERVALLDLLRSLTSEQWALPTVCAGWSVKDIASHIVADDLGRLGSQRDGWTDGAFKPRDPNNFDAELRDFLNERNEAWVEATRRLSPALVLDMLVWSDSESQTYFESLDPDASNGFGVGWAGEAVSANWFDLAREYTERWHHQAQIREAVGAPLLLEARLFMPVIDAMIRAVPYSLRSTHPTDGTQILIEITSPEQRQFTVRRESRWTLCLDAEGDPQASVIIDGDTAWRLLTRNLPRKEIISRCTVSGDPKLTDAVFDSFALLA